MEEVNKFAESTATIVDGEAVYEEKDPESNSLHQSLLKRNRTLSSSPLAIVGAKVSHIESLDFE